MVFYTSYVKLFNGLVGDCLPNTSDQASSSIFLFSLLLYSVFSFDRISRDLWCLFALDKFCFLDQEYIYVVLLDEISNSSVFDSIESMFSCNIFRVVSFALVCLY